MPPVPATSTRDRLFDAAAVLLALTVSFTDTVVSGAIRDQYSWVKFALFAVCALALGFRRRAPVAVAWFVAIAAVPVAIAELVTPGVFLHADLTETAVVVPPAAPFAAYSAVVYAPNRRTAWVPIAAFAVIGFLDALLNGQVVTVGAQNLVLLGAAVVLGLYAVARRRLFEAQLQQALVDDRSRIAAEMHDVVTHRVSLMVLQAGTLRLTAPDEATRATAEELRATGCHALEELRDLVGILRKTETMGGARGGEQEPIPELAPLIAESESVGLRVELVEEGVPALTSPVVARTVYRIVQEGLTNVRKHAPGAHTEVRIRCSADDVRLIVRNTAPLAPADPVLVRASAGTGLLGLRQRVELISGTMQAAPEPDGGFCLEAILPLHGIRA